MSAFLSMLNILVKQEILGIGITVVMIVLFAFSHFIPMADASHDSGPLGLTGEEICRGADEFSSEGPAGTVFPPLGGGPFVPVRDFDAEASLRTIASRLNAIESDINRLDLETRRIRYYLRQLCEKEYVHDHTIQHAWAEVIGRFVEVTQDWVRTAYNENPIFLTNQTIYYSLVDWAVILTFMEEIEASDIDPIVKRTIAETAWREIIDSELGTAFVYEGKVLASQVELLRILNYDFNSPEEFQRAYNEMMLRPENYELGLVRIAIEDLSIRRNTMRQYEQEKLAWGRGFFSYEICDLEVISDSPYDRRNCRIATPGSLIQDQVSLVFGSALRQMELNDEFEEWIAPNTLAVLNDTLNFNAVNSAQTRTADTDPAPPAANRAFIEKGAEPDNFPQEFRVLIEDFVPNIQEFEPEPPLNEPPLIEEA